MGHREHMCVLLINLGATRLEKKAGEHAEHYLQEGLTLEHQIGHREWIAIHLGNSGLAARE